jgi:hypothetical protein
VSSATQDDDFLPMEQQTLEVDRELGGQAVRHAWAHALAEGASNARLAPARRAELLRRAGRIAYRDLGDPAQAFDWFNEAMFVRMEATFDAALAQQGELLRDLAETVNLASRRLDAIEQKLASATASPASQGKPRDRTRRRPKADEPVVLVTYPGDPIAGSPEVRTAPDQIDELPSDEVFDDLGGDSTADEVVVTFETGDAASSKNTRSD